MKPSPLQLSQAPLGELNEKIFGSGFGREIPLLGHINCLLKLVISPFSII